MKIAFNPNITNYSYNYKTSNIEKSVSHPNLKQSLALECLAFQNQIHFTKHPVYVMDYWGNYNRYASLSAAESKLDIAIPYAKRALDNKNPYFVNCYAFDYAKNIEAKGKDGKMVPCDEKLLALSKKFKKMKNNAPLYFIDYSGKITRFNNRKEAKAKFNSEHISWDWTTKVGRGLLFARAYELEIRDEKGKVQFDESGKPKINYEKLHEILDYYAHTSSMPIYLVDKNKNVTRCNSSKDAQLLIGCSPKAISEALSRGRIIQNKYTVINAFDLEKRDEKCQVVLDENNEPVLDEDKVLVYVERFNFKRGKKITLRNLDTGEVLPFDSRQEAANKLGVTRTAVSNAVNRKGTVKGYLAENG